MKTHAQYTIRGIPEEVDRVLRETAKRRHVSMNQLIVDELTKATVGGKKYAVFGDLVGRWAPDEAFDAIIDHQREINPDDWK